MSGLREAAGRHQHGLITFNIFASLAELERDIVHKRTKAGLDSAKARGRRGGRPQGLSKAAQEKAASARILFRTGTKTMEEIAKILGIGRATCYHYRRCKVFITSKGFLRPPGASYKNSTPYNCWKMLHDD